MLVNAIWFVRAALRGLWVAATLAVLGLVALNFFLPSAGRELFVVSGGSMEPSIPLGAAVIVRHTDAASVAPGDVITYRGAGETVITHRVMGVASESDTLFLTKGDNNSNADPLPVPGSALIGSVEFVVPAAGSALLLLASTGGVVVALGLIGSLAMAVWFMDELHHSARRPARRRVALPEIAR